MKSNRKDHCGVRILQQDSTGPLINEFHFLCSVFRKEDDGPLQSTTEKRMVPDMEPIITEEGVVNLLNTLQPNKAGGPDKIPSRVLKEYVPRFNTNLSSFP